MAIPTKDSLLVPWGSNFDSKVTANPDTFSLDAAQALAFHTAYGVYASAYTAVAEARAAGARSKTLTSTKDQAKKALLVIGRELYAIVQDSVSVSDADKDSVGVWVRKTNPTPTPPPATAPDVSIVKVSGRAVRAQVYGGAGRRGRPIGTIGAMVYSAVGTAPPEDIEDWKNEGIIGKGLTDITFPDSVPAGSTVWITAQWFNGSKQTGPAADPVSTNLPGGLSALAA